MSNACSVDGCRNPIRVVSDKLCNMHYKRKKRTGETGNSERRKAKNGEGTENSGGYRMIYINGLQVYEHIAIAEAALGKPLPQGAQVHHVDEVKSNNKPKNLVICPNESYHRLLHLRTRALKESGNANYLKCPYCKKYDSPDNLKHNKSGGYSFHPECHNASRRDRRTLKKGMQL